MRIAVVDTYYPAFLEEHHARRPELAARPYAEQHAALMDAFFGTADSYGHHLRALGHDAVDLVVNCDPLQLRWAAENGLRLALLAARAPGRAGGTARAWLRRRIALAQVAAFDPDVVYAQNLAFFSRRELDGLRGDGRLVVGQIASPLPPLRLVRGFALVLTSFPHFVDRLRAVGVASEYFRLAADARVLDRLRDEGVDPAPESERPYDVVFVGGVHPQVHARGTRLLESVCARRRVDVWGYGAEALPPDSPILRHFHGEAWGLDMYRALARAKVALNRHIDAAEGHANNMRLYEATAMGALLVTDHGRNLKELFAPGRECLAYDGADELEDVLDGALADRSRRLAIAAAGQARTLREHSFERRMEELVAILTRRLQRPSPARPRSLGD
jgi:spore maturation protein CgeB